MKRLLVTTDFSTSAFNALRYATQLFKNEKCKFLILHSFETEISTLTSRVDIGRRDELFDKMIKDSQSELEKVETAIVTENANPDHSFLGMSTSASLSKKINKLIKAREIDLVIMGNKGTTASTDIFLGSNTVRVIRKIKGCPLLIIPNDLEFIPPKIVAFPTAFKRNYNESLLKAFKLLNSSYKPVIKVVHITEEEKLNETQKKNFKNLTKLLRDIENETYWIPKTSKKAELINKFIKEFSVDIIVMIFYKNNLFKRLTRERVIKKTAFQSTIPLMVIPDTI